MALDKQSQPQVFLFPHPTLMYSSVTHQTDRWLALAVHQCLPKPKTGDESPALPLGVPRTSSSSNICVRPCPCGEGICGFEGTGQGERSCSRLPGKGLKRGPTSTTVPEWRESGANSSEQLYLALGIFSWSWSGRHLLKLR